MSIAPEYRADTTAEPASRRKPRFRRDDFLLAALLAATALVYARCLRNGLVYDDIDLILNNRYIGQWSFLWKAFVNDEYWFVDPFHLPQCNRYRPLLLVWIGLHYRVFGVQPAGWHATMVALHLAVVVLVFRVASRLTGNRAAALLAAALFALLPAHAEAVVWVAGAGPLLAGAFELGAFDLFIRRARAGDRNWAFAMLLYGAALLCHELAAAFPAVIACYVFLLESGDADAPARATLARRLRDAALGAAPFAAELAAYLAVRRLVLGFATLPGAVNHATVAQGLMTLPLIAVRYAAIMALPWTAGPAHRVLFVRSVLDPDFYLPAAAILAASAAFAAALRSSRRARLYLFCAAWAALTLSPVLYLPALLDNQLVHDNYTYLPSVGFCVMIADLAIGAAARSGAARRMTIAAAAAMLALCAAGLWRIQPYWHDDIALFSRCVRDFPESAACHGELGTRLEQRGQLAGAERELSAAIRLNPRDGMFLYDLGVVHARLGRLQQGVQEASDGLARLSKQPAAAYVGLAQLYRRAGDASRGEAELRYAESLPGGDVEAGLVRARDMAAQGDKAGVETLLRRLTARHPDDYRLWAALGEALAAENRDDEALAAYARSLATAPADPGPHFLLARTLRAMGRNREALAQCHQALALAPGDARTLALMAEISSDSK